jgi:hypothetical protein
MRRRRIALLALVTGALGSWACGLGVLGSATDGTAGGDAASSEASADASASTDATPADGGSLDATTDATDAAPDGPITFCTTVTPAPTFCADFDDPADASPSAGWTTTHVDAGSSLASSTTVYTSAPRSLHATSPTGVVASVESTFTMLSTLSVEFDVRYASLPASGAGDVSPVLLTPPTFPGFDVYYFAYANGSYFQEYGDDYSPGLAAPSLNTWHHVKISITTNGTTSTIDASVDGTAGWTNHTLKHAWPTPTIASVRLGLAGLYQVASAEAFIDNVVVRVQ